MSPARDDGWRPIASAPRDGTRVLLCAAGWDEPVIGSWEDRDGDLDPTIYTGDIYDAGWKGSGEGLPITEADLWQPLPAPPAVEGVRDGG